MRAIVFVGVLVVAPWISVAADPPQVPPVSPQPSAFTEFTRRVQQYVKLHKAAPRLRTTKQVKEIANRREALAREIRQARPDAKEGDIFTPEITEAFRRVIQRTFQGPQARNVRGTVREGVPLVAVHLAVNADYPERLPLTTVPPTLLLRLPRLPAELAYRIVGHDFVLQDTQARLIVDVIPGIIP